MILALILSLAPVPVRSGAPVLKGLDPVELARGREVAGSPVRSIVRFGHHYVFASDATRTEFEADPARFEIQMGGACARMGPLSGKGDPDRFTVHDGRIYVFASDACREGFLAAPDRHIDAVEPPLAAEPAAIARGKALVQLALDGLGGAAEVDAIRALERETLRERTSGGKTYATRETWLWRFPDDLRSESAWDERVYTCVATRNDAFQGSDSMEPLSEAGLAEFRRRQGREALWLLRHRDALGFEAAARGESTVGDRKVAILRIRFEGNVTDLHLDAEDGRVLRTSWTGRIESGVRGEVVVDHADFREEGGILLPHARELRFDGKPVGHLSGPYDAVAVDPEIPPGAFLRGG